MQVFISLSNSQQVGLNGVLSLRAPITSLPKPHPFPLYNRLTLIAPLWTDVDAIAEGTVSYRQTQNTTLLQQAALQIRENFGRKLEARDFSPKLLFLVTWSSVIYEDEQVCCVCYKLSNNIQVDNCN